MASGTGLVGEDNDDPPLRPTWDETEDETDIDLRRPQARPAGLQDQSVPADAWGALLVPLCAATDALARLDARTEAAATAIRDGLIARLAYLDAAGFLAHAHAWAHPLDLALRERGLTASAALAAAGAADRALPQTVATTIVPRAWVDSPLDELATSDVALAEALALARALHRLAGKHGGTAFPDATATAAMLQTLGASRLDPAEFTAWWDAVTLKPVMRRPRFGRRREVEAAPPLPPLLAAAHAAGSWMEAGLTEAPTPAQALLLAAAMLARAGVLHAVCRFGSPIRPWATCAATTPTAGASLSPGHLPLSISWRSARGWVCANSTGSGRRQSRAGHSPPGPINARGCDRGPAAPPGADAERARGGTPDRTAATALLRELQTRRLGRLRSFAI